MGAVKISKVNVTFKYTQIFPIHTQLLLINMQISLFN